MINPYFTQSFKSFPAQEINKKRPTHKVGFLALNKSDQFTKTNNTTGISFTSSSVDPYKELNDLKHQYLNLNFTMDQKFEVFFKSQEGVLFAKYLLQGENPAEILSNHASEFSNINHLNRLLKSTINREPAIDVLKKYQELLIYRNGLLKKINDIEERCGFLGKVEKLEHSTLNYADHVVMRTPLGYNPNYSECFRYQHLYKPFKTMVEEKVDKLLASSNPNFLKDNKLKVLVVGLGKESEEVHDYATYAYNSIKSKGLALKDVLDFDLVDLRSQDNFLKSCINVSEIDRLSFGELPAPIQSTLKKYTETGVHYSYNYDVLDFVYENLRDKDKAHFHCPIEDYMQDYKGDGYDFVSINNVLQYLGVPEGTEQSSIDNLDEKYRYYNPLRFKTDDVKDERFEGFKLNLKRIASMVKPGGYLSCRLGTDKNIVKKLKRQFVLSGLNNEFDEITTGLYRKKKTVK